MALSSRSNIAWWTGLNRLLLADDDTSLCAMLKEYLQVEGYSIEIANDGQSALDKVFLESFDLLILDVMMPKMNGLEVLKALRQRSTLPVLMLTARGDDVDSIIGLGLGADDYVAKPCNPAVLSARIQAILRRSPQHTVDKQVSSELDRILLDDVEIRPGERRVLVKGNDLPLTSTEYNILEMLAGKAGHVVAKDHLYEQVLGRKFTLYDRSLDMHISSIRKKLGPLKNTQERIKTVRGVGYQYVANSGNQS